MFGYIRPAVPELKVKEHELYRAFYCGLCRAMRIRTTCFSSLTLSYDFVFLAMLRTVLEDCETELWSGRCVAHPLRKRAYVKQNPALEYCSAAAAVLTRGKVLDDIHDKTGLGRLRGYLLLPAANIMQKRGKADAELIESVEGRLSELSALEKRTANGESFPADAFAELFGRLLGDIFAHGLCGAAGRIAYEIGFHTGKWIYFIDAADDLADDIKKSCFNPYKAADGSADLDCGRLRISLTMELRGIEAAVELIDFGERFASVGNIIRNTIYLGMPQCAERIIAKNPAAADKN